MKKIESTPDEAVKRLRRFVEEDPDLLWGDVSVDTEHHSSHVHDSFGGSYTVKGYAQKTISLNLVFTSSFKTAVDLLREAVNGQ